MIIREQIYNGFKFNYIGNEYVVSNMEGMKCDLEQDGKLASIDYSVQTLLNNLNIGSFKAVTEFKEKIEYLFP